MIDNEINQTQSHFKREVSIDIAALTNSTFPQLDNEANTTVINYHLTTLSRDNVSALTFFLDGHKRIG